MKTKEQNTIDPTRKNIDTTWQQSKADNFWGEIASCDHVVQIYDDESILLNSLTGFVGGGINAGDSCIVIATESHLNSLEYRLADFGLSIESLIASDRYFPLDADKLLAKFMVDGMPDEKLFCKAISGVLSKAGYRKRRIRAFGEMVAMLWKQGNALATIELENIWNRFCAQKSFCLFCAYPRNGFMDHDHSSITHICNSHNKIIAGSEKQLTEVIYRNVV